MGPTRGCERAGVWHWVGSRRYPKFGTERVNFVKKNVVFVSVFEDDIFGEKPKNLNR